MSNKRANRYGFNFVKAVVFMAMIVLLSIGLFGCKKTVNVQTIAFSENEILMLVGEEYTPSVSFSPTDATNKGYTLSSSNEEIVTVESNKIKALASGEVKLNVVSAENNKIQDVVVVKVFDEPTRLETPKNLAYDPITQTISFNDDVMYAAGYTLSINDVEYNLGNVDEFKLADHAELYNQVLTVKVKSNAYSYTSAFLNSDYSGEIKFYQVGDFNLSVVGGVANLPTVENCVYDIYLGGDLIFANMASNVDLTQLNSIYAGRDLSLAAQLKYGQENRVGGVNYYASNTKTIGVKVLPAPRIDFIDSQIYFALCPYASHVLTIGENNFDVLGEKFDLSTAQINNNFEPSTSNYIARAQYKINADAQNIVATQAESNQIKFNRLTTPNLSAQNNVITWQAVENAQLYNCTLTHGAETETFTLTNNNFNLDNYSAGEYSLSVSAVNNGQENDVYYLPSVSNAQSSIVVTKQQTAQIKLEQHSLKIDAQANESYKVYFDQSELTTLSAQSENTTLTHTLNGNYVKGEHTISVVHLGNNSNIFDSAKSEVNFYQLGNDVGDLTITNGVISIDAHEVLSHQNAKLLLSFDAGVEKFEATTYNLYENKKAAGQYTVTAYVEGDGASVFSYREDGEVVAVKSLSFTVLNSPNLTVASKEEAQLSFNEIEQAQSYEIYSEQNGQKVKLDITPNAIEPFTTNLVSKGATYFVKAIGNGKEIVNSDYSEGLKVYRLSAPTLSFDSKTNIVSKTEHDDEKEFVSGYKFTNNGAENNEYDFASAYSLEQTNNFEIRALAVGQKEDVYYLDSAVSSLQINKIASEIKFTTVDKLLVIEHVGQTRQYNFELTINDNIVLHSEGNKLIGGNNELDFTFNSGKYSVVMFNEIYKSKIESLTSDFSIKVKFIGESENNLADSNYSEQKTIKFVTKVDLVRENQTLTFNNIDNVSRQTEFSLLVNEQTILPLNETIVLSENKFIVPIDYLKIDSGEVYSVSVISLNTLSSEDNLLFSSVGDKTYVKILNPLNLTHTKSTTNQDNSVKVSFEIDTSSVQKTYSVKLYNLEGDEQIKVNTLPDFYNSNADGNLISIDLDKYNLTGTIYISAKINTSDSYMDGENTVQVFNSPESEAISFVKIDTVDVSQITTADGVLHFNEVENAIGYDIYKETATSYEKINSAIINTPYYNLKELSGLTNIKIKAISVAEADGINYTNSNLTASIQVGKLPAPQLSTADGNLVVTIDDFVSNLFASEGVNLNLIIFNGEQEKLNINLKDELALSGITKDENKLIISPELVLNYKTNELIEENLLAYYSVSSEGEVKYLSSANTEFKVYGLVNVLNITKSSTIDSQSEILEHMNWQPNDKNILNEQELTLGYKFKLIYNEQTYYSTDPLLMYGENLSYPSVIVKNSIDFPIGYDKNKSGAIDEDERFDAGNYMFSVQVLPKQIGGLNLLSSAYLPNYNLIILAKPTVKIEEGKLVWNSQNYVKGYRVQILNNEGADVVTAINVQTNSFDFSGPEFDGLSGVYQVRVRALSESDLDINNNADINVVSSNYSPNFNLFRLGSATDYGVENGYITFTANKFFTSALISLTDGSREETFSYSNEKYGNSVAGLSSGKLEELSDGDYQKLNETKSYVCKINNSAILNVTQNRNYKLTIQLIGNSSAELPLISSAQFKKDNEKFIKLNSVNYTVSQGKLNYFSPSDYKDINYNFFGENSEFFKNTKIYKITIKYLAGALGKTSEIYAVDYNSFTSALGAALNSDDYKLYENYLDLYGVVKVQHNENNLYINIYKDNIIDFNKDTIYYFPVSETVEDGNISFAGCSDESQIEKIDLTVGGAFVVDVMLLGGDTDENFNSYLTSNVNSTKTFLRYGPNQIEVKDGVVYLNDLRYKIDNSVLDLPVYRLEVTALNGEDSTIVYLYYDTQENAQKVSANDTLTTAEQIKLYQQVRFGDASGKVYIDFGALFDAGNYSINIRTLSGVGGNENSPADYLLNSKKIEDAQDVRVLSPSKFSVVNGVLTFDQAFVEQSISSNLYVTNYEISLTNTNSNENIVFVINEESEGVTINDVGHTISYELPNQINYKDKEFTLNEQDSFAIKLRGVIFGENNIINAKYYTEQNKDYELNFAISPGLENAEIENGVLTWQVVDNANYQNAKIIVKFLDKSGLPVSVTINNAGQSLGGGKYSYQFGDGSYWCDNQNYTTLIDFNTGLVNGIYTDYTIEVKILSKSQSENVLNSLGKTIEKVNRLQRVDASTIRSHDGVLTWDAVEDAEQYLITFAGINKTFTSTETTFNPQGLIDAGKYNITIRAIGSDKLNAIDSNNSQQFTSLGKVQNIHISDGKFAWDEVENAKYYSVVFSCDQSGEMTKLDPQIVSTNSIVAPAELSGNYNLTVQAVGVGDGYEFNGEISEPFVSTTSRPSPVKEINLDSENYTLNITVADDFTKTDSIKISYILQEYIKQNGEVTLESEGKAQTATIPYNEENNYSFALNKLGVYSEINVEVERALSISSSTVSYAGIIDYHIFNFGDGDTNPYEVASAEQLLSIGKRPTSKFKLTKNINLFGVDIAGQLTKNNYIIADNFSGELDGDDYDVYIQPQDEQTKEFTIEVSERNFALFNSLNGAKIKNLTIGKQEILLKISNTFANNGQNVLKLNMIANDINGADLTNVKINNVQLELTSQTSFTTVYIAGFASEANGSTLTNCSANISVKLNSAVRATKYVSALIARATDCNIIATEQTDEVSLAVSEAQGTNNSYNYIGAVAGSITGSSKIEKAKSSLDANMLNVTNLGGIAGSATTTQIVGCVASGTYSKNNISQAVNLGGILGNGLGVTLRDCNSSFTFTVTLNSASNVYIGGIAGSITNYSSTVHSTVTNCTHTTYTLPTTQIVGTSITVGQYGRSAS